jgi:predicted esterase
MYRELPPEAGVRQATIIALHGHGGDLDQLVPLCQEVGSSFHILSPEGRHPTNPEMLSSGYREDYVRSYKWYMIDRVGYPEPASIGISLAEVEQFVFDVLDRQPPGGPPLFLLGYDQGAVLVLTAVGVLPEYVAGVVGICGYLPEIRGWSPPVENAGGLPVLLVHDPQDPEIPLALVQKTVEELGRRSAAVELQQVPGARQNPLAAAGILRGWLGVQMAKESSEEPGG